MIHEYRVFSDAMQFIKFFVISVRLGTPYQPPDFPLIHALIGKIMVTRSRTHGMVLFSSKGRGANGSPDIMWVIFFIFNV